MAIGWHSPAGFRHPGLHEYEGEGGLAWLRSFSGPAGHLRPRPHPVHVRRAGRPLRLSRPRKTVSHSLHGRVGTIPARLTGYGETLGRRRLRAVVRRRGAAGDGVRRGPAAHPPHRGRRSARNEIRLHDRVVNHGFYRTPHMYCYHINVGHPVLAEGSRYLAPITDVVWAAHAGADYRKQKRRLPHHAGAAARISTSRSGSTSWRPTTAARCRSRSSTTRLGIGFEVVTPQGPVSLHVRVAELAGRPVCARHRAVDQPRARPQGGAASAAS